MALALFQGPERDGQTLHKGVGRNKRGNEEQAERRRGGRGGGVRRIPSREPRTQPSTPPPPTTRTIQGFVRTIAQLDVVGAANDTCRGDMRLFVGEAGDKDDGKPAGGKRETGSLAFCLYNFITRGQKSVTRARRRGYVTLDEGEQAVKSSSYSFRGGRTELRGQVGAFK